MRLSASLVALLLVSLPVVAWAQLDPEAGERTAPRGASKDSEELPREDCAVATPAPAAPSSSSPGFWVGAVVQGDLAFLGGGTICDRDSQGRAVYSCFRSDREQYLGVPAPSEPAGLTVSYGTTRIALSVERSIFQNFTAGVRFGVALGGGPTPSKGPTFVPLHLEARAAYWIGRPLSSEPGIRGYLSLAGGLAQMDASRAIDVEECRAELGVECTPATNDQPGGPNPDHQVLDAYKKAGQAFVGLGAGLWVSFVRGSAAVVELRALQFFPSAATTLSPSVSYVFHVL